MAIENKTQPKQLPFWPGVIMVAIGIPILFWLKFGRIDGYAIAFTVFLLLVLFGMQFIPKLSNKYGAEQASLKVKPGRFDKLGVVWLLSIPFAPFLMWIISEVIVLTLQNWKFIVAVKVILCVAVPCVCVLPLLRYLRGKAAPYALFILVIGTGYPVTIGWSSMMDFIQGARQEKVSVVSVKQIHMTIKYRDVPTSVLKVELSDGRILDANVDNVQIESGPAEIILLAHQNVIIAVKKETTP